MNSIVKHDWNGQQVSQAATGMEIQGQEIPAGAVYLTEIAKTHGKDAHEFLRLPSTQAWISAYTAKSGKIPVFTFRGRGGGIWGILPIALKMCAWLSPELDLWGSEVLTKVVTGQAVTNDDRAEGWAHAASLGAEIKTVASEPELPPEFAQTIRIAMAAKNAGMNPMDFLTLHRAIAHSTARPFDSTSRLAHLSQFFEECVILDPESVTPVTQIWKRLEKWYVDRGVLEIRGKDRIWGELPYPDELCKGSNQVIKKFLPFHPSLRRISCGYRRFAIVGMKLKQ